MKAYCIVHFNEEGRAAFLARKLAEQKIPVYWVSAQPNYLRVGLSREEFREFERSTPGVDPEWFRNTLINMVPK